ncbi:MAG: dNTP triphosphohydrolase [Candidatus Electrothrix sp. GW3-4]|uniref:deoxyguanosinetriphosphate triphosphohydrolase family protein n=1 Tax=Candidatus Electrothrix sp. GW3-4 TaxID=3126740 RepID=UPI0030CC5B70
MKEGSLLLADLRENLAGDEKSRLSPLACLSQESIRRKEESRQGYRQPFAKDADRILHAKAYTRYIDKTQVFSLIDNDHITHRVLHVQLVSRIARTAGRFLGLNEDLVEAIALGHDIGHPPFGHEGEHILDRLCQAHGLPGFRHNIQSVQFLDRIEKQGTGWNLTLQVLDGILCHDGEANLIRLVPARQREKSFSHFDHLVQKDAFVQRLVPMTLEGCLVRLADTIAYIGRDIEDAIELNLITRQDLPAACGKILGRSNGTIVHNLVSDLITNSAHLRQSDIDINSSSDYIGFSENIGTALLELKEFNYERIYRNPLFKPDFKRIHSCYEQLFSYYLDQLMRESLSKKAKRSFWHSMSESYLTNHAPAALVRDYLAGMTDKFFLHQAEQLGCDVPERKCIVN